MASSRGARNKSAHDGFAVASWALSLFVARCERGPPVTDSLERRMPAFADKAVYKIVIPIHRIVRSLRIIEPHRCKTVAVFGPFGRDAHEQEQVHAPLE